MVIHALLGEQFPDDIRAQPMTCATCGTTWAAVMSLPAIGILVLMFAPSFWGLWLGLAALAGFWGIQIWWVSHKGDCERPLRGNMLVALSRWAQHRWFVSTPTEGDLELAIATARELLAAANRVT